MYFFSVINTLADLAMMWLFLSSTQPDDRMHPLATIVACSTGPYFFNLYPTIMNSALFGLDISNLRDIKEAFRTFEVIYIRDSTFKSIMLGAYTFFVVFAGLLVATGLIRCARHDRKMTRCQLSVRTGLACAAGLIFSMAFYNKFFDVHHSKFFPNGPFCLLIAGHVLFVGALLWGSLVTRKINDPTENQLEAIRNFNSLYIFGLIISVPLCFMEFQMISFHTIRFMFSDYESFVRLIFFASILLLEPYNSRFRFRERFYRTSHECPIAPQPVQTVSPIPKKMNIEELPPNYDNMCPPAYDAAQSLPATWAVSAPSKQYTGVQMTPVETK